MATAAAPISAVADAPAVPEARSQRWLALDMFRFTAVLLMVQGHVFSTLLDQAFRTELWYRHHQLVHGYTAPMFLVGSGLAFGYTTFRKWDEHKQGGAAALKRFKRYFWLLVIGYALHLPESSLARVMALEDAARVRDMLQVDVLQHIGVSLGLAQLLVLVLRQQRIFVWVIGIIGAFSICAAPWIWSIDLSQGALPLWLAGYVNGSTGSIFPFVPWAGFTYLGIVIAYAVGAGNPDDRRAVSERLAWPLLVIGLAAMLAPVVVNRMGSLPLPAHNFWKTDPLFTFWRLGNVMIVLALFCFAERAMLRRGLLEGPARNRTMAVWLRIIPWIRVVAAQSLIVYVIHLIILHGCVLVRGLRDYLHGPTLTLPATIALTLGLSLAMIVLAKLWSEIGHRPRVFAAIQWGLVLVLGWIFVTS